MTLDPGAIRDLHWYANAAKCVYVMEERTHITLKIPEGRLEVADLNKGGLWYFPRGWGHSIEGLGPEMAKFLLVLNNVAFFEGPTSALPIGYPIRLCPGWCRTSVSAWSRWTGCQEAGIQISVQPPPVSVPLTAGKPRGQGISHYRSPKCWWRLEHSETFRFRKPRCHSLMPSVTNLA